MKFRRLFTRQFIASAVLAATFSVPIAGLGQAKPAAKQDPAKKAEPAKGAPAKEPAKPATPAAPAAKPDTPATPPSAEAVDAAIRKGCTWLLKQQTADGTWELAPARKPGGGLNDQDGVQWGGRTALATYALLTAGVKANDPQIVSAVDFLKRADIIGTYALSLRCLVWSRLPRTPEIKSLAQRDASTLLSMVKIEGAARGFYDYKDTGPKGDYSHSRGQYGVLGIWAASQVGADIPRDYWEVVEEGWIGHQHSSGGWTYKAPGEVDLTKLPLTAGMTAAGVATLFITQDFLHANDGLQPKGNITNPAIEKGLSWMAQHMDDIAKASKAPRAFPFATLYAVERIGVASGRKYIGDVDWYEKGASWLVGVQGAEGGWPGLDFGPVPSTSFCLLFLARGRAPVMMNKLEYQLEGRKGQEAGPWNQRPRDVANITRWVSGNIERDLNWQIVNLNAPLQDLLEAPILYISGAAELNLSEKDQQKLKNYLEAGGMIVGNADGGRQGFSDSFKKLGESLLGRKFRELPADHVIYTNQQYPRSKWRVIPQVQGLSNGVRELMIIAPSMDLARAWQQGRGLPVEAFQLPSNVFLYAVDKQNLKYKGQTYYVTADAAKTADKTLRVARLQYKGNWDPEPGGWTRLATIMNNQEKTKLLAEPVELGAGKLSGTYRIAHLTGTDEIKLSDAQKKELADFVKQGGTLIIDAAGGQGAFATAIETELAAVFGDAAQSLSADLPADHPIFSSGKPLTEWEYRPYVRVKLGSMPKTPRLRGMEVGGRLAVLYSPMDLTAGLVGQQIDGIYGYAPQTATQLMQNLLVYASANR